MGAWSSVMEFIEEIAEEIGAAHPRPRYAGRPTAASPATGLMKRHNEQQAALIDDALTVGKPRLGRIAMRKRGEADIAAQ